MRSAPPRMTGEWVRVSRGLPCPICRKPDWCTVSADGSVACCMRIESERRLGNGGWLHRLGRDMPLPRAGRAGHSDGMGAPRGRRYLSPDSVGNAWARWAYATGDEQVEALAGHLGVTAESLRCIGACWAWPHAAWGFPMFDGGREFSGIRLRSEDGEKWALRGSRQGIFLPDMETQAESLVVEGPTDAAAAVTLGFHVIGRPSCTGGAREIGTFCRQRGVQRLSVLADNDGPGIRGARALCAQVGVRARIVVLPAKDLREWLRHGATRRAVEACLAAHGWH